MTKQEKLHILAIQRQQNIPQGYKGIGDYHNGAYECDYVSPYTRSANNVNADVMFLLQDWSSDKKLRGKVSSSERIKLGYNPNFPTNKNLKKLLQNHLSLSLSDTYGTNLFPFIKPGGISAKIHAIDLVNAAKDFAIPQIEIVSPKVVICLGKTVYTALCKGLNIPLEKNLAAAIAKPFLYRGVTIWTQSHPGGWGQSNRNKGGVNRVSADWAKMARSL